MAIFLKTESQVRHYLFGVKRAVSRSRSYNDRSLETIVAKK